MKSTGIKVTEVTQEFVANHETRDYNPREWANKLALYVKDATDIKWFYAEPQNGCAYGRFYVLRTISEGLRLLQEFGFSTCLTNNGFKRAFIVDNEIFTRGFGDTADQCVVNNKQGRQWLVNNICQYGTAVTTSL